MYPKLVMREYFIPNFKRENTVYLKLDTPVYCIPKNSGRPCLTASFCFQIKHEKKKKEDGKRAREDEDVVKALLFNAFERHQYYNLKDLISITKQPVVRIAYEIQGGGVLLVMAYMERPRKGHLFQASGIWRAVI